MAGVVESQLSNECVSQKLDLRNVGDTYHTCIRCEAFGIKSIIRKVTTADCSMQSACPLSRFDLPSPASRRWMITSERRERCFFCRRKPFLDDLNTIMYSLSCDVHTQHIPACQRSFRAVIISKGNALMLEDHHVQNLCLCQDTKIYTLTADDDCSVWVTCEKDINV